MEVMLWGQKVLVEFFVCIFPAGNKNAFIFISETRLDI